jgi:signal transduction histidine kinase
MLAKANQELDRFVYSTSHDLRAPLSSLLGLINIAAKTSIKEDRDKLIAMMSEQIIKLDSYIQDITDYSRNARVEIEREIITLHDILEEAIQDHRFMKGPMI